MALARAPLCATSAALGLDLAAVDLAGLRFPALLGQCRQNACPNGSTAPPVPAIIDRRRQAILSGTVRTAATALKHVYDPRDHPSVINTSGAGLVLRQMRLDRRPCLIRQPEQRT